MFELNLRVFLHMNGKEEIKMTRKNVEQELSAMSWGEKPTITERKELGVAISKKLKVEYVDASEAKFRIEGYALRKMTQKEKVDYPRLEIQTGYYSVSQCFTEELDDEELEELKEEFKSLILERQEYEFERISKEFERQKVRYGKLFKASNSPVEVELERY